MISQRLSFGELLKTYRIEAEMTQADLAERAGVGLETIGALERGVNMRPRKSTVDRLCDALELGPDERAEFEHYAKSQPRPRPEIIQIRPTLHGDLAQLPRLPIQPDEGQTTIPMSKLVALSPAIHNGNGDTTYPAYKGDYDLQHDPALSPQETDRVHPEHGDTPGGFLHRLRLRKRTAIMIAVIAVFLATTLLLLKILPPQPIVPRLPAIMNIVGDRNGMQLQPVLPSVSGFPCVIAGQPVTVTFTVQNTDATKTRVGLLTAVEASVRGPSPDPSKLDWGDPVINFPAVVQEIRLLPGETFRYEQSRSFSQPGSYFVEPTKSGDNKSWAGFSTAPRIYFRVVPAGTQTLADAGCVFP